LEHVDADIAPGEVVGLAGLLGSGRSETAQLIFGAQTPTHGTLTLRGVPTRFSSPRSAIAKGIGLLPENRKTQGLFPSLSVLENLVVSIRARDGVFARLPMRAQIALAEEFVKLLGIKTPDVHAPISGLSGGNQQKVLLARWFAMRPILLILDEPTRGIDIAAKADVLRAVEKLRAGGGAAGEAGAGTATNSTAATTAAPRTTQTTPPATTRTSPETPTTHPGTAVLFISSELEEVTRVCSRVVVLRDRRSIAQLSGSEITEQAVLAAVAQAS
ncbi:MAG: ATP-binding cassette domain-containing protein, partial [Planctomycetota bacterium]|nr:ATP-binding cassette domain-containing protein [Planctomycetota bacterium]